MDILKKFKVSYYPSGKEAVELVLYFDNGSFDTFIKRGCALKLAKLVELTESELFSDLGGGDFYSKEIILLHIKLLEFWCRQLAYVVEDKVLEVDYDILAGHGFMQGYGIKLFPEQGEIEVDEARLRLAQRIR